jgi:hypothetical protein
MKKVSFDFDGTLSIGFFGEPNPYKDRVHDIVRELIAEGFDVHIITRRYEHPMRNELDDVYAIAFELGIPDEKIFFTNREWKYSKINELGIEFHIDDDETDIRLIENNCPNTIAYLLDIKGPEGFYDLIVESLNY